MQWGGIVLKVVKKSVVEINVNGIKRSIAVRPADTLLYALREQLGLTSVKNSCGTGDCGTCTVLLDRRPVKSCQVLAVEAIGHQVTTLEGLAGSLIQKAFVEKFAIQCGYCTPALILNCYALISLYPDADDALIDEWLESNICRCTGYYEIKEAVKSVLHTYSS